MKLERITPAVLTTMRAEVENLLKAIGSRYGVQFTVGRATYTHDNATFKLEVALIGKGGKVLSREAKLLEQMLPELGLTKADLNTEFELGSGMFKLVGYNTRAHRQPMQIERRDGRRFKCTEQAVLRAMGKRVPQHLVNY